MPCGGIFPVSDGAAYKCFQCNKPGCDHFVEEWDARKAESSWTQTRF